MQNYTISENLFFKLYQRKLGQIYQGCNGIEFLCGTVCGTVLAINMRYGTQFWEVRFTTNAVLYRSCGIAICGILAVFAVFVVLNYIMKFICQFYNQYCLDNIEHKWCILWCILQLTLTTLTSTFWNIFGPPGFYKKQQNKKQK